MGTLSKLPELVLGHFGGMWEPNELRQVAHALGAPIIWENAGRIDRIALIRGLVGDRTRIF